MKKVLLVKHYLFNAKTYLNDAEILSERFELSIYNAKLTKGLCFLLAFTKQFFHHYFVIRKYDLVYIWFADYHSLLAIFFAKLFNKKSVINVGGFDATYIPEIKCGAFNKKGLKNRFRYFCLEYSFRNCDYILTVDDSLIKNENHYIYSDTNKILKDGVLTYMPDLKTKIKTVYTCYKQDEFKKNHLIKKIPVVLSVGLTPNWNEFKRKGFDKLVEVSAILSNIKFVIIGVSKEQIISIAKLQRSNLELYEKVPQEELFKYFSSAKVYAQLSLFEGLPNTLCEAMLFECIPVGSNVNGIPVAIGNNGFIVYKKDINEIVEKITLAINSPIELGTKARNHIVNNFSYQKRSEELQSIINNLFSENCK